MNIICSHPAVTEAVQNAACCEKPSNVRKTLADCQTIKLDVRTIAAAYRNTILFCRPLIALTFPQLHGSRFAKRTIGAVYETARPPCEGAIVERGSKANTGSRHSSQKGS